MPRPPPDCQSRRLQKHHPNRDTRRRADGVEGRKHISGFVLCNVPEQRCHADRHPVQPALAVVLIHVPFPSLASPSGDGPASRRTAGVRGQRNLLGCGRTERSGGATARLIAVAGRGGGAPLSRPDEPTSPASPPSLGGRAHTRSPERSSPVRGETLQTARSERSGDRARSETDA